MKWEPATPSEARREMLALVAYFVVAATGLGVAVAFLGDHADYGVRDLRDRARLALAVTMGPLTGWFVAGFPPSFGAVMFLNVLTGLSGGPAAVALSARSRAAVCFSALFWAAGGYLVIGVVSI